MHKIFRENTILAQEEEEDEEIYRWNDRFGDFGDDHVLKESHDNVENQTEEIVNETHKEESYNDSAS